MVKGRFILLLLLVCSVSPVVAQVGTNVTLISDYLFRGFSQTDEKPAIQAGADYTFGGGFNIGVWGSNVQFGEDKDFEVDWFGGYSRAFDNGLRLDVGYVYYGYLDIEDADADDAWLGLGYKNFDIKYWRGFEVEWDYIEASMNFNLPRGWHLGLGGGWWRFAENGGETTDWKVGLSRTLKFVDMEIAYADTDVKDDANAGERVILSFTKTWTMD